MRLLTDQVAYQYTYGYWYSAPLRDSDSGETVHLTVLYDTLEGTSYQMGPLIFDTELHLLGRIYFLHFGVP